MPKGPVPDEATPCLVLLYTEWDPWRDRVAAAGVILRVTSFIVAIVPFHAFVLLRPPSRSALHAVNLNQETLGGRFIEPYNRGEPITWDGKTVERGEIAVVRVSQTEEPVSDPGRAGWSQAVRVGTDITNAVITGPPGAGVEVAAGPTDPGVPKDPRRVMVVHGRNTSALNAMATYLRALGLEPILWEDAVAETGIGSPHNLEAVIAAMQVAQAVIVIFTAEDEARLRRPFRSGGDPDEDELKGQPRANVLLEAGMAMALGRDRTILTRLGDFRGASDVDGLNAVRLGNDSLPRAALRRRLANAGCAVNDLDHYLNPGQAGDFDAALETAER